MSAALDERFAQGKKGFHRITSFSAKTQPGRGQAGIED
jgi:hypothetical protein